MDFALTDDQRAWQEHCHRFADEVMRPAAEEHDRDERFPREVMLEARRRGLYDIELLGRVGADPDGLMAPILAEELHWGCAGMALALGASTGVVASIAGEGTPEQVGRWLPECYGQGDEIKLAAYAVTEPGAGSDTAAVATTARRRNGGWALNGVKTMIGNGGIADVTLVVASVDPSLGRRGQATFIVPKGTPGLAQVRRQPKLGVRASHTAEIELSDCELGTDLLLGGEERLEQRLEKARARAASGGGGGGGSTRALALGELTRPLFAAGAVGIARAAYEWALERVESDEQAVQQALADVATEIDAARLLTWRAAWMARNGIAMAAGEGSMAKLKAADVAVWACSTLMDLVGPAAGAATHPLGKCLRDAKVFQIFEGTAQVLRGSVARLQRATAQAGAAA